MCPSALKLHSFIAAAAAAAVAAIGRGSWDEQNKTHSSTRFAHRDVEFVPSNVALQAWRIPCLLPASAMALRGLNATPHSTIIKMIMNNTAAGKEGRSMQ